MNQTTKRKELHLSQKCISTIAKIAIDEGTVFKLKAEKILEDFATKASSNNTSGTIDLPKRKKKK
jgi:uncharacterized alkaline shock family protein YloU